MCHKGVPNSYFQVWIQAESSTTGYTDFLYLLSGIRCARSSLQSNSAGQFHLQRQSWATSHELAAPSATLIVTNVQFTWSLHGWGLTSGACSCCFYQWHHPAVLVDQRACHNCHGNSSHLLQWTDSSPSEGFSKLSGKKKCKQTEERSRERQRKKKKGDMFGLHLGNMSLLCRMGFLSAGELDKYRVHSLACGVPLEWKPSLQVCRSPPSRVWAPSFPIIENKHARDSNSTVLTLLIKQKHKC